MPKTATPRKPETVSSKLAETRAKSKNRSLSSLLGIGDNEKRLATDLGSGLNDVIGRGTIAGLLGLPGDLGGAAENGLRSLLGLPQVVPYGGSEHIGQKMEQAGLVSNVRRPKTELLASLISPAQAATAGYKAPQMARAGVKALDNLSAPRTMGRQQGAIENLWHGSPHTFDRFDLSKIGTGEGAQAYGHGAYLAESNGVADSYRRGLSNRDLQNLAAESYDQFDGGDEAFNALINNPALSESQRNLITALKNDEWLGFDYPHQAIGEALKNPGAWDLSPSAKAALDDTGNLYQTRLAWPDAREATDPLSPDHFLHWDKPLSEQSKFVRNTILESDLAKKVAAEQGIQDLNYIGARHFESPENSAGLRDLGIPGIRYLDGGSRGAGAGSHNYVVFDDKLIDIVSRNGQPVGNLGKMVAPQDEALRVAQANAAKPVSEGGLGLRPDNTPEERAAAMGFDTPAFHGTRSVFDSFDPSKAVASREGSGNWFTSHPEVANTYAGNGGNVLPVLLNKSRFGEVDTAGANWQRIPSDTVIRHSNGTDSQVSEYIDSVFDDYGDTNLIANISRQNGDKGLDVLNSNDRGGYGGGVDFDNLPAYADNMTVFDPRYIRSRFAAFDPMRRDSSDLLAGLAPFGAVPWLRDEEP